MSKIGGVLYYDEEEINAVLGQHQIENINSTINLIYNNIRKEKIETLKKHNIQKSIQWCVKHKIPYNKINSQTNIFLTKSSFRE